jgi:sugar O-acyltransferase (sialic acid O-acetyltransferase NeuD family)
MGVPKPLIVVGAGGFGRETIDAVMAVNAAAAEPPWNLAGVVDDAPSDINRSRLAELGVPYLGTCDAAISGSERPRFVVAIGSPRVRRVLADRFEAAGFPPAVITHPAASIGRRCRLGDGTIVLAGARLTTNISLGRHVHVNPNATVGHDTVLGDFVSLNPACSISGDCRVGEGTLVGVGAVVLHQLVVGSEAVVGAGACVVRAVPDRATVKGVPAR